MAPNRNTKVTLCNVRKATSTSPKIVHGKRKANNSPPRGVTKKVAFSDVENNINQKSKYLTVKELLNVNYKRTQTRAKSNQISASRPPLSTIVSNAIGERLANAKNVPVKPKVLKKATIIEQVKEATKPATRSSTNRTTQSTGDNRKVTFAKKNEVIFSDERKVTFAKKAELILPDERKVTFADKAEIIDDVAGLILPDERKVTFADKPEIIDDVGANTEQQNGRENESFVKKERPVTRLSATFANKPEVIDDAGAKTEQNDQESIPSPVEIGRPVTRLSARLSLRNSLPADKSTDSSLYISAVEEFCNTSIEEKTLTKNRKPLSEFDKESIHDPHQVSLYAMEIFDYLKTREANFVVVDYMEKQCHINANMRAVLVDWMVEVQESFELNHETLYLAVKIVDVYLSKVEINKEKLQLIGAAALFLACKYDERLSPLIEDFVYICDNAYTQDDFLAMEQSVLRHINFELSFPISYRFLRRYARCARIQMPLLTLARYILELALLDYNTITLSDSKQAAAALYLAFKMVKHDDWTDQLVHYTGYEKNDLKDIVLLFNRMLHQKPNKHLTTIRTKYSHELFFEVTKTPLINDDELDFDITNSSA